MNTRLSDDEFALVQNYVDVVWNQFLRLGLNISIDRDFALFASVRGGGDGGFVYPTFDPRLSRLGPNDFWLKVTDRDDRIVATCAHRLFEVEDFYDLLRSERLWYSKGLRSLSNVSVDCELPPFGGVLAHCGGIWVHGSQRKRGLPVLMPALGRALMLRNHAIDHDTGLLFEDIANTRMAITAYGYARQHLCMDGYFPPSGKAERVYLCHLTRAEALEDIAAEGRVAAVA